MVEFFILEVCYQAVYGTGDDLQVRGGCVLLKYDHDVLRYRIGGTRGVPVRAHPMNVCSAGCKENKHT